MDIEKLLKISRHASSDKEVIEMILSNRISHYLGDKDGAAIGIKNFSQLADDILKWHESKNKTV